MDKETIKSKLEAGLLNQKVRQNTGILIKCIATGRFLLLKRASPPHHGKWALLSGQMDNGEDSLTAIKREIGEEISINPNIIDIQFVRKEIDDDSGTQFFLYKGFTDSEFIPTLDHENVAWGWFEKDKYPSPIFPGLPEKMQEI